MRTIKRTFLKNRTLITGLVLFFSLLISDFAYAANSAPVVGTISPASGSGGAGTEVAFTTTYSDANGWQNIQYVHLLINTAVSGTNCFYGYYNQNTNLLYIRNDANTAWLGGYAPGSSYTIENSYVKLACSKTTVSGSGNVLTVKWYITFKPAFRGTKYTYLYVKDDANAYNGWVRKGSWTITNQSPTIGTLTPSSGTGPTNTETFFTSTFSDTNGWQDIQYVYFLINTAVSGTNCFYGYYNQNTNKLYIRNNANTGWVGGYAPGTSYIIENSYAKLNCATTTISGSANTMAVKWAVTFKSTFTGAKKTYLYVRDDANAYQTWVQKGTWTVSADSTPPTGSITINSGAQYTSSTSITLTLSAQDNTGGSGLSQMQFSNDGTTYSTAETYATTKAWTLTTGDSSKTVYVKFKDNAGNWSVAYSDAIYLLTTNALIKGKVTDTTGTTPVPAGTWVSIWTAGHYGDEAYRLKYATTQADGSYELYFSGNSGLYDLDTGGVGYIAQVKNNIQVTKGQITNLDFKLEKSAGIQGKVFKQDGSLASGVSILIWRQDGVNIAYATSQTDGTYLLYWNIPSGTYNIEAYHATYGRDVKYNVVLTAGQLTPLDFTVKTDSTPPTGTISINSGAQYTSSASVTLTLSAQDNTGGSGLSQMQFSNDGTTYSTAEAYATTKAWTLTSGDGSKTVYVKFKDNAGNWSVAYSDVIYLLAVNALIKGKVTDTTGTISVPAGTWVSIWTAGHFGDEAYRLAHTTTQADGSYELYFGGSSGLYDIDTGVVGYMGQVKNNIQVTKGQITSLDFKLEKSAGIQGKVFKQDGSVASGVSILIWRQDGVNIAYATSQANGTYLLYWNIPSGTYNIEAYHATYGRDVKYNVALTAGQLTTLDFTVKTDSTPPTGTISINSGAQYTSSASVTLTLSAQDNTGGSGVSQMQFSNDGTTYSTAETYATTKTWTLTTGDGSKTVYVKFKDNAGNWSVAYSDAIVLDAAPPTVTINNVTSPTTINNQTITGTKSTDAIEVIITTSSASVGPVSYPTSTTWSCYLDSFTEGNNVINAVAKDAVGNSSAVASKTIVYTPTSTISPNIRMTTDSGDQINPSVAVYQSTVYAVWQSNADGKIYFDKSTDGGLTWNVLRKAIDTGTSAVIDIDASGNIYICWTLSNTLYFVKSIDGGVSFSNKLTVSSGYAPDIAVSKSGSYVYIIGKNPSASNSLIFKKSTNGGISFDYGTTVTDPKAYYIQADQPKIECSESARFVYVLFAVHYNPGAIGSYHRDKAVFAKSQDYGATFETPKMIAPEEYNSRYPDIATRADNEVYISWQQDSGAGTGYWYLHNYFVKSTNSGSTFSSWVRIDSGDYASTRYDKPALSVDDSARIYTAFVSIYPNRYLYYDLSENAGLSFGADRRIDETGTINPLDPPKIASNSQGNNICIIWSDNRNGNYDLYCTKISKGTTITPKPTLDWIKNQVSSYGIVDSYEADGKSVGWTYDQALAVLALTKASDTQNAQKVLNALKNIQNPDGSWYFCYYTDGQNADTTYTKYVGTNAWVIMAASYYTYITGDRTFIPMIEKTANWISSYQDTNSQNPTFGSVSGGERNGVSIAWRSTEHNITTYASLRYLSDITGNPAYNTKANQVKNYLLNRMWTGARFLTGWNDTTQFLDVNSWAVLALGQKPNGIDIAPCLQWAYDNLAIYDNWDATITNIHGFDENKSYNLPLDKVWSEGSEGMVGAYYRIGNSAYAKYFHNQTYRYQQSNGGVPYSTPNSDGTDWPQYNSIAGTAWFYFNEVNPAFNPLDPYLTQSGAASLLVDDFNDAVSNINVLGYMTSDDGTCSVNADIGQAHQLSWANNAAYWYTNFWTPASSTYRDVSQFVNLTFDIKGNTGGEKFVVRLQDKTDKRADLSIINYASLTTSWQTVNIPLRDFLPSGIDLKNIKSLSLCFLNDATGTIYIDNIKFTGAEQPPVANAGTDQIVTLGNSVTLDGSGSYDDGIITSYTWELGDGTIKTGKIITHTYLGVGNYTVTLTVTDNNNSIGTDTAFIMVRSSGENTPPTISNIIPESGTIFQTGDMVSISIEAWDLDLDALEYQFSINGQVKQAWSASSLYNWTTTAQNKGRHAVKCEVRDGRGGTASREIYLSGFRRAVGPPTH